MGEFDVSSLPLVVLSKRLPWGAIEQALAALFARKPRSRCAQGEEGLKQLLKATIETADEFKARAARIASDGEVERLTMGCT
jgi:hypothetical protein